MSIKSKNEPNNHDKINEPGKVQGIMPMIVKQKDMHRISPILSGFDCILSDLKPHCMYIAVVSYDNRVPIESVIHYIILKGYPINHIRSLLKLFKHC